jgi:hypothetical protein
MMFKSKVLLTAASLSLLLCALPGQSVQLRDGSILVGEIQDVDGEGFTLLRTDNGGELKLRWNHLTESSAKLHRSTYGLLNTDDEEVTVRADVVSYASSTGKILEAIGRIVKKDDTSIYVRTRGDVAPIRRADIRGLSERLVTPFEIFTKLDYYNELLAKSAPGEDADKHLALGELLMRVRDYGHAEDHLKKAKELGGGRQPKMIGKRLEHLQLLKGAAAEQKLLDDIRMWTNRSNFKLVDERIAEFKEKYPGSKLQGEFERLVRMYKKVRTSKLARDVARLWYKYVGILATRKAADSKCTFAVAKQYGEREMGKEIREHIAKSLSIEIAEVDDFWESRFDVRGAASGQHYHYSIGSWLLGEKGVLKETKQGKVESDQASQNKSKKDQELDKGIKRIQEALRKARQARQRRGNRNNQGGKKKEMTPEDWWRDADRNQRTTWLKAYYGEYGGDMKLTAAHLSACSNCGGAGRRVTQGSVGQSQQSDCPVCHRTRFKRDIRVR